MLPLVMSEGARTFANGLSDDLDDKPKTKKPKTKTIVFASFGRDVCVS